MENKIELKIYNQISVHFKQFLNTAENERVIFSGKFGSGKTTFLKYFFDENKEYEVIRISPVNYSISSNDDIIDLIKYDIIIEFLLNHIEIITTDAPSYQFISEKDIKSIFSALLSVMSFKGVELKKIYNELKELKRILDEKKSQMDEGDTFINFLDKLENETGLFERDIITKTIEKVINRLSKKSVLLIDDLDRVDPEHIFRILNVFSAHFDNEIFNKRGLKNKFGYDKIIIVCDYVNLQSLFYSRYGKEADYNGYIDKFYNRTIFEFDIKEEIEKFFIDILFKMDSTNILKHSSSLNYFGKQKNELLDAVIVYSILNGHFTIRSLNRLINANIEATYSTKTIKLVIPSRLRESYTFFLLILNFYLFKNTDNFIAALKKIASYNIKLKIDSYLIDLIYQVEYEYLIKRTRKDETDLIIKIDGDEYRFIVENGSERTASKISRNENLELSNNNVIDVMEHFISRIKEITGIN